MIQSGAAAEDQVSQVMSREDGKRVDSRQAEKGLQRDSRGITTLLPSPRVALSGSAVTKFKQGEALQAWPGLGLFSNRERAKKTFHLAKSSTYKVAWAPVVTSNHKELYHLYLPQKLQ